MPETWTLPELVTEAAAWLETLPPPKNGQVRAVPDERTIRYYATIGLLDRPAAMRGRTALYNRRHLAQVVAIKRLQSAGRSLAEIQALWPTLDDVTLARMTGVQVGAAKPKAGARKDFWKREIEPQPQEPIMSTPKPSPLPSPGAPVVLPAPTFTPYPSMAPTLNLPLDGGASLSIPLDTNASLSAADVRALIAAAKPLLEELAKRGLIAQPKDTLEEP